MSPARSSVPATTLCLLLALGACGGPQSGNAADATTAGETVGEAFRVVTVAQGLEHPWSIAFLPGGNLLVTERPGRLRRVGASGEVSGPIAGVPQVHARGQGGLLDVTLHPDFESNGLVYLTYSKPLGEQNTTAVIRGRLVGLELQDVEEIFEARAVAGSNGHFGSRMAFDDEGYLFVTIGDRQESPSGDLAAHGAQDLGSHNGTIVRLNDDGSVPEDNPFVGQAGALPEIWSYGHRSPQGLAFHPGTGDLWMNEHGPQGGDEVNRVVRGANYGWPVIGYGVNYGSSRTPIHASTSAPGMEQPVHYWVPSIATSGLLIYDGDAFPEWRGSMFVGGLDGEQVARLTMSGNQMASEETLLEGELGRVRDIRQGPDGFIYLALDEENGATLVRLEPAG